MLKRLHEPVAGKHVEPHNRVVAVIVIPTLDRGDVVMIEHIPDEYPEWAFILVVRLEADDTLDGF